MAGRITWAHTLYCTLLALWLGSFFAVGALAVPVLFATLPSPLGADTAVVLFRLHGILGFVMLALLAAFAMFTQLRSLPLETKLLALVFVASALLHFWVIPEMLAQRFQVVKEPLWHVGSSSLYLLQGICLLWVFTQRIRTPTLSVPEVLLSALPALAADLPPAQDDSKIGDLETTILDCTEPPLVTESAQGALVIDIELDGVMIHKPSENIKSIA
jgi:hypothetical protein